MLITLLFVASGCRKNRLEPTVPDSGFDYFPSEIGNTWVYQVDSIRFNPFAAGQKIDTFTFFIKHVVSDTTRDNNGIKNSIISSFRSNEEFGDYTFERSFARRIVDFRAETIESNVRTINLVFPPTVFKYWDTNAFNTKKEEENEIIEALSSEQIGQTRYDSTVHVLQRDDDFKTLRNYGLEKYAKHKGLVYSHQIHWTKKTLGDTSEIPEGYDYTYILKRFTK